MPIALPAPATPELSNVETVRGQGTEYVVAAFQDTQVHVHGPDVVDKAVLELAITSGSDLSDVVRQIQAVYYAAGYPAVRVLYALSQPDLYIQVSLGKVDRIDAPAPYNAYFEGLAPIDPLTDEALEPARTMASLHADRAGESAMPIFKTGPEGVVLAIEPTADGPDQGEVGIEFGNPGNRFVGRHFLDYFGRATLASGDEIRGTGRHAMNGLEDDSSAAGYSDHSVGWTRVTPYGLFGITGRYVGYQQALTLIGDTEATRFDGDIRQAEAAWLYLLSADFENRWTMGAKVDFTRKDFARNSDDALVQRQEYGSVELSTEYTTAARPLGVYTDLGTGIAVRSGLGDDKTDRVTTLADLGYLLLRPSASARASLGSALSFGVGVSGQFTDDTVPEQQQWVLGGIGNGEAYLPGVAVGDSGALGRVQLEFNAGEVSGIRIVPRVFAEYAYAKLENPVLGQPGGDQTFADVGVSLSFSYANALEIAVSYAESIEDDGIDQSVLDDADANLFFKVGLRL